MSSPLNSSDGTTGNQPSRLEPHHKVQLKDTELEKIKSEAVMETKIALVRAPYHIVHTLHKRSMFLL
jgi:hypothetical protein